MARPALATADDLEVLLGQPPTNVAGAEALLARASAIVRAYAGQTWLDDDESELVDVPGDIPGVVAGMVERATRNPDGITQEQAGPFARSFGPEAAQRLYLDKWEKLVVRAAAGIPTSGIGVLETTRGDIETPAVASDASRFPEETKEGLDSILGAS